MTSIALRKRPLERLSSPEDVEQLVRVTLPRRWLALAGLLALVFGAVGWSIVASVPTTVSGPGFLLPLGGVRAVQAPASGTVSGFDFAVGKHAIAHQRLGQIVGADGTRVPIAAPETGVVTELDAISGDYAAAGDRIALVSPVGWPLVLYAYVKTEVAADLAPGTPVHVVFGGGIGSRFGYAVGHVETVSQYAATYQRLTFTLQDTTVVDSVRALGPANEVVIDLDPSARTPSGVVWGRGSGPRHPLPAGLPAHVAFVIGSHHPIDDVL